MKPLSSGRRCARLLVAAFALAALAVPAAPAGAELAGAYASAGVVDLAGYHAPALDAGAARPTTFRADGLVTHADPLTRYTWVEQCTFEGAGFENKASGTGTLSAHCTSTDFDVCDYTRVALAMTVSCAKAEGVEDKVWVGTLALVPTYVDLADATAPWGTFSWHGTMESLWAWELHA